MNQNRVFIRQVLHNYLPSSIVGEVACFVFYDHHPRDGRCLDATICTNRGEVLEYYQRDVVSSLKLEKINTFREIKILRNSKCELFYLVVTLDELIILSTKNNLQEYMRVSNCESHTLEDLECKGSAILKITRSDDAVPLVFDENLVNITEKQFALNQIKKEEPSYIVAQLKTKLTEAKYTTKHNEAKYKEYVELRQAAALSIYEKSTFNMDDSNSKLSLNKISKLLQVTTNRPVIKLCNKKIIIIIEVQNNNNVCITEVCPLLHNASRKSIEYCAKVFEKKSTAPFWNEKNASINSNEASTVVAVVDLKEIQFDITSRIEFEIVISYTKKGKNHLLPVKSVSLSASDIMGEKFDALLCDDIDRTCLILCIISTSECLDLNLVQTLKTSDQVVTPSAIFLNHMNMEMYVNNIAIHKLSPFHILYGAMIVFSDSTVGTNIFKIKVYTRSSSQVLALVHYMYDIVPNRIIICTSDYKVSENTGETSNHYEDSQVDNKMTQADNEIDYRSCTSSMLHQIKSIKEYLNNCKALMEEDSTEQLIDITAMGVPNYLKFKNNLLEDNLNLVKNVYYRDNLSPDSDCMVIDDDPYE